MPEQNPEQSKDFSEIGGSPVPGLTLRHVLRGHKERINRIAWSSDGQYLASPSHDETVRIWDVERGECLSSLKEDAETTSTMSWLLNGKRVYTVSWLLDGKRIVSGSWNRNIVRWEINGSIVSILSMQKSGINTISCSPLLPILVVGKESQEVVILNSETGELLGKLIGHRGNINNLAWSPSGKLIATASGDKTVRIWNRKDMSSLKSLSLEKGGHINSVNDVLYFSEQNHFVTCSDDRSLILWKIS